MNNVVYIKHFDNGAKYVGITKSFNKRMYQHNRVSKSGSCDHLPLYRAMKKHKHYTEIVFWSEDYSDILKMEKIIIRNFKDLGIELYNLTDGGEGICGFKFSEESLKKISEASKRNWKENREKMIINKIKLCGVNNPKAKPYTYYEEHLVERCDFKKICKRQGWKFEDFKEVYVCSARRPCGMSVKKYNYFYIGESKLL